MNAEIVTVGDEILFGHIVDTNSAFIGQHLSDKYGSYLNPGFGLIATESEDRRFQLMAQSVQ